MVRFNTSLIFIIILASLLAPFSTVKAQTNLAGGQGSNLVVKVGALTVSKQTMLVKLHVGFAQIEQNYTFINEKNSSQKVSFGFPYTQGEKNNGLDNINISADNTPIILTSSKELNGTDFIYWKTFEADFAPYESRQIKITHWQLNSANFRGMRTFKYSLKNKLPGPIGKFNLQIFLMDGITLDSFNKTSNPDLDLKLEPVGWTKNDSSLNWQWQNFEPGFDLLANFYWPNGDLAKVGDLKQTIGLYEAKSSTDPVDASQTVDSSYLTHWLAKNPINNSKPTLDINFASNRKIEEIQIIPGIADDPENFKNTGRPKDIELIFDDDSSQQLSLQDSLSIQDFKLTPIETKTVKLKVNSVYAGATDLNDFAISEVEFGTSPSGTPFILDSFNNLPAKPTWQNFFINIWDKFTKIFTNIFS